MIDRETTVEAMRVTLENARSFLDDSRTLQEQGSAGHASSLAILGFEEAHKAYLLVFFLPLFDTIVSEERRKDLKSDMANHQMKQALAAELRVGIEILLTVPQVRPDLKRLLQVAASDLKEGTNYVLDVDLSRLKNAGFYVDPFRREVVWDPRKIDISTLDKNQFLLGDHIKTIEKVVDLFVEIDSLVPQWMVRQAGEVFAILREAETQESVDLRQLKKQLEDIGELGKLVGQIIIPASKSQQLSKVKRIKKRAKRGGERGPKAE